MVICQHLLISLLLVFFIRQKINFTVDNCDGTVTSLAILASTWRSSEFDTSRANGVQYQAKRLRLHFEMLLLYWK